MLVIPSITVRGVHGTSHRISRAVSTLKKEKNRDITMSKSNNSMKSGTENKNVESQKFISELRIYTTV